MATRKDKSSYSYHIMASKMHKRFAYILGDVIKMFFYDSLPIINNILIISHQNIKRTQLHHFLQTNHHHISLIDRKIKQPIQIPHPQLLGIHRIAIPRQHVHQHLLIRTILCLLQYTLHHVIVKIFCLRHLFFLTQEVLEA